MADNKGPVMIAQKPVSLRPVWLAIRGTPALYFDPLIWLSGIAIATSATAARAIALATLSLAKILLKLIVSHIATDIGQFKDDILRRHKAQADAASAEAKKKLAEAAEAVNRAALHKRKDALAKLEREAKELQNAKTQAEIHTILHDADTRRIQATAEAQARLIEAISKLRQEGGDIFFSQQNLLEILHLPQHPSTPPPPTSDA